jgi:hypothetical protein
LRLLYAEALKIRTAPRTLLGMLVGLVALAVLGGGSTASDGAATPFENELVLWDVLSIGTVASIFSIILGILIVTWEYRHGTITQSFLTTPRRERVVVAKYATALVAGALLAVLTLVVLLITAQFWISIDLDRGQWELVGRLILASALWCLLGAGLGAVLQSQVGGIVTAFVWFLVAESVISVAWDEGADYLPGNALDRFTHRGELVRGEEFETSDYAFGIWTAGLLATGYALALAAAGIASVLRRDVT